MELSFSTERIRDICEIRAVAQEAMGLGAAEKLERCLADLDAAEDFAEFISIFSGELRLVSEKEHEVVFDQEHRLVICSGHVDTPLTEQSEVDWSRVTRTRIVEIRVTHG